jgi:hypothetical protein
MPSNKPVADQLISSLILLFRLIEANDWVSVEDMFLSNRRRQKIFLKLNTLLEASTRFYGMTILHACARFDPPPKVVSRIIELCPQFLRAQDSLKRTPLHVMAGTRSPSSVIKILADAYPLACMIQDSDGCTPLHFACDGSCQLFENDEPVPSAPSYTTIGVLLMASPESVILEDNAGRSAIEYALCSDAELKTVRLLQKAARRAMSRRHEEMKNQIIVKEDAVGRFALRKCISVGSFKRNSLYAKSA